MKTVKHFLTLIFVSTLSFSTLYSAPLLVDDIIINSTLSSISVNWDNQSQQSINVKIVRANQEIAIEETVKNQPQFSKQYSVANLENGDYKIIITKKTSRIVQPFNIQNGAIILSETDKKVTYFPIIKEKDNSIDVSVFLGYKGTIEVNVLNDNKEKIFTQTYNDISILHKRYSLNSELGGTYKIEVKTGDETFYYSFVK